MVPFLDLLPLHALCRMISSGRIYAPYCSRCHNWNVSPFLSFHRFFEVSTTLSNFLIQLPSIPQYMNFHRKKRKEKYNHKSQAFISHQTRKLPSMWHAIIHVICCHTRELVSLWSNWKFPLCVTRYLWHDTFSYVLIIFSTRVLVVKRVIRGFFSGWENTRTKKFNSIQITGSRCGVSFSYSFSFTSLCEFDFLLGKGTM